MKKILITMAAVFAISMASAQTDPKQVPQSPQTPSTPLPPAKTEVKAKPVKDDKIQKDAVSKQPKMQGEVQPRKDELKTQDHVKGTSKPMTPDTIKPTMNRADKKKQ